jgi:hypothetical protein
MVRNHENGQRGTVCIKKIIEKSSNFLAQGKIRCLCGGQEEIKMATQAADSTTQAAGSPTQAADYTRSLADCCIIPRARNRAQFGVFQDYSQSNGPVEELVELKR